MAVPRSMGPAVFLGSPPTLNTHLVPPGVCGSWPLLTVWDLRFSWAHRQPSTHIWSLLSVRLLARSSQDGTRGFPGLTANPQHTFGHLLECAAPGRSSQYGTRGFLCSPPTLNTHLVPPGVCGSWPFLAVWGPRFVWAHHQPNTHLVPPGVCGSWPLLAVWDPRFSWAHRQPSTHIWSLLECAAPGRSSQYGTAVFPGSPQPTTPTASIAG